MARISERETTLRNVRTPVASDIRAQDEPILLRIRDGTPPSNIKMIPGDTSPDWGMRSHTDMCYEI
ncbi:hypothetical protein D3OALGB2SA_2443 [Olavius algarvensis associated proteobacterium Delta 3]|nr:hypothetical protein D3OALGB2SA_2443 [Olavius algarvensis associated proteobacterium Delta 3]